MLRTFIQEKLEAWLDWGGRVRPPAAIAICALAAVTIGLPTLFGAFLSGDDFKFAVNYRYLDELSLKNTSRLLTMVHVDLYQPLPMLSFQLNHAMAAQIPGGQPEISPLVFHITNVLLHAVNAVLVYLLVSRLARDRRAGILTAFMFAWHPLAVEPVAWISGRMILLGTTFSLITLCFCAYRKANARGGWPLWAGLSWLCALASKIMPTVPIAAAICDWHLRRRMNRKALAVFAVLLAMAIAASGFAYWTTSRMGAFEAADAESSTSAVVKLLLAARQYIENYAWPMRLAGWSPPPDRVSFASMPVAVALLELAGLALLTYWAWRKNRTAFVGIVLFAVLMTPFLAATLGRRLLVADRYMYLPIVGLHMAVTAVVLRIAAIKVERGGTALPPYALLAVLLFWWAYTSMNQASHWQDSVASAKRVRAVYPDDPAVWANLGAALVFQGRPAEALRTVESARESWPGNGRLAAAAGAALVELGRPDEAEHALRLASEKMPRHPRTLLQLGQVLEQNGRHDEARATLRRALEASPGYTPAAIALARSLTNSGDFESATTLLRGLVEAQPEDLEARYELAMLLLKRQDWRAACDEFARLAADDPRDQRSMMHQAVALTMLQQNEEALAIYDRLLTADPSVNLARINRAGLFLQMQRFEAAERDYRLALDSDPDNREVRVALHALLQRLGRYDELVSLWLPYRAGQFEQGEVDAWLAWSYALAGKADEAADVAEGVSPGDPWRELADWACAWSALQAEDAEACLKQLGPPAAASKVTNSQRTRARVVLEALAALPESTRRSDLGYYALARAFLFEGDPHSAALAAGQLRDRTSDASWRERVEELQAVLGGLPASRPTTSESTGN